ncbi:uncharacterized protein LOC112588593 [Harpegnathos saltator]|uniref:uncharacterized protein LOC112588593 n=1 Tax=Harpegnathos saltator TaxID=610380 RepID=UPI000DBEEA40|nr:uncharacterized protein LOC112588593 [Harpegnathos saltator]
MSLDIKNAFNTLPWPEIGRAFEHHGVPVYFRLIPSAYFGDRNLAFPKEGGVQGRRAMERDVPQRSVLCPLLWNIASDRVLRTLLPPGCHVVCYADDMLVVTGGRSWGEAGLYAEAAVASMVSTIGDLGLKVAPQKTEAVQLASREHRAGLAVASLLRNQGGPGWRARGPYVSAVLSIAMYGAPQLLACRDGIRCLRQALRPMYIRAIRGYRTISYMAATTLAGSPPVELLAEKRRVLYWRTKELREEGELTTRALRGLKSQAVARTLKTWGDILSDPRGYGRETTEAIRPYLPEMAGRRGCGMTFHLVQVLTGYGCFGKYLHRIGKKLTTLCHHCPVLMDTAHHTLAACPAWREECRVLARAVVCRE